MKYQVTSEGVRIPPEWLDDAAEVEIERVNGQIVVTLLGRPSQDAPPGADSSAALDDDPIWGLGSDPVDLGVDDASVNHDQYLESQ
jgi:hypothetical protein